MTAFAWGAITAVGVALEIVARLIPGPAQRSQSAASCDDASGATAPEGR